jgi:GNAT superfamily N-acetyltransferase
MQTESTGFAIRQATEDDRETLVALFARAYQDVRMQQCGVVFDRIWDEWQSDLRCAIDIRKTILAEVAGEAVGFATYKLNYASRIGIVDDNAVLPGHRGQGVGAQLFGRVLELIEEAGMEYVQVTTGLEGAYSPARRMYERQGFEPVSSSVTYFKKLGRRAK